MANCPTIQHVEAALKAKTNMSDYDRGAWLRDAKYGYTWAVLNKGELESKRRKFPLFTLLEGIHITGPLQQEMIRNARQRYRNTREREKLLDAAANRRSVRLAVGDARRQSTRSNSVQSDHPMGRRIAQEFGGEWLDYGITRSAGVADDTQTGSALDQGASGRDGQAQAAEDHRSQTLRDQRATAVRDAARRIQSITARRDELRPQDGRIQRLAHPQNGGDGNPSTSTSSPADIGGPF